MAGLQQVGGNYERRRTVVLAVLISGLLSAFSLPGASSDNPHRVRLQLKWYHQFQFAGYYAAEEEGYYAQEELEVSFIEGDPSHPPIGEVLAGRAEFGVSDADLLKAYIEGKPVVALASIFQHSPYILIARADSGIRTPGDLKGKVIMLDKEQGFVQLKAILQREGIPMDSLNIVPHQWSIDPLIQRKVDVLSAYSTAEPFHLKAKGVEPAAIRAMDYGVDFYGDTLFTTREQIRRHPDTVAAFRRASLRGWKYALDHPDEIIDLILAMPNVERRGITREMLQLEEKAMRDLVLPDVVEIGHMNLGRWEAMSRTYANAGLIRRTPTQAELQGFIYIHPKTTGEHWVAPLLLGLAMLGAVAAGALLWSIQLRRAVRKRTTALQEAEQRLKYHGADQSGPPSNRSP